MLLLFTFHTVVVLVFSQIANAACSRTYLSFSPCWWLLGTLCLTMAASTANLGLVLSACRVSHKRIKLHFYQAYLHKCLMYFNSCLAYPLLSDLPPLLYCVPPLLSGLLPSYKASYSGAIDYGGVIDCVGVVDCVGVIDCVGVVDCVGVMDCWCN